MNTRLQSFTSDAVTSCKDSSDYASCESIVSGKGRVSVLKKSSMGSLNSVVSANSCLRTSITDSRSSSRKEKHGVSFAVPYTDPCVYTRQISDPSNQNVHRRFSVSRTEGKSNFSSIGVGTPNYPSCNSHDQFSNLDEFGIIVGASSDSSIVSGTYSYDAVIGASTDSEISVAKKYSPMRNRKSCEVDPWNVESVLSHNEPDCILIRKDTPPPKPVIPSTCDKDLREFIKRRNNRPICMSTQSLRWSRGVSSENLVSQYDSNEASLNSLDYMMSISNSEVQYENIATISEVINSKNIVTADTLQDAGKKHKSPDESTYL